MLRRMYVRVPRSGWPLRARRALKSRRLRTRTRKGAAPARLSLSALPSWPRPGLHAPVGAAGGGLWGASGRPVGQACPHGDHRAGDAPARGAVHRVIFSQVSACRPLRCAPRAQPLARAAGHGPRRGIPAGRVSGGVRGRAGAGGKAPQVAAAAEHCCTSRAGARGVRAPRVRAPRERPRGAPCALLGG